MVATGSRANFVLICRTVNILLTTDKLMLITVELLEETDKLTALTDK
ncbi:hypothetical protein [Bacillus pakistanensis]|nr:hypothetical protein [Bacillus pakistanensis]